VVSIASPLDDATVTQVTDIVATVTDDNLVSYTLAYASLEDMVFTTIATGTENITDGILGQFDPTIIKNGTYVLRLTAVDAGGNVSTDDAFLEVDSNAKIGNFSLGFTDLSTSLGGLPITIGRTYDTLNADEVGDFGYGWNLDLFEMDIRTDVDFGESELSDIGIIPSLQHGTRLHVTLPDGTKQSFTMQVVPINSTAAAGLLAYTLSMYRVEFVPDADNTSTLTTTLPQLQVFMNEYGELETGAGMPFNPASPYLDIDYIMTTQDGTEFLLDGNTGELSTITDRQGNRLEVSDDGIRTVMPSGEIAAEISFTRDQLGRIKQITDTAGATINYTYDTKGDLVAVTDRVGSTTTFIYNPDEAAGREHYLTSIEDARGVSVMNLNFDETTGRIISLADASGAAIPFNYDLNPPQLPDGYTRETLADADDVPTEIIRDGRGNTVRQLQRLSDNGTVNDTTDDLWSVTVYEYDANDYRTRTSETFQATGDAAYTASPTTWLSEADYDPFGNVLSTTDSLGNTTYFTYDRYGSLLTTTDAQGNTTRNTYSDTGLLTHTTDALGNVTSYAYDSNGNMTAVTDSNGNVVSTFVYDSKNQLLSTTDINGNSRFFKYDDSGNQTHSWSYEDGYTTLSVTEYDAAQRVTASYSYTLTGEYTGSDSDRTAILTAIQSASPTSYSSSTYSETGQVQTTTDLFGNVSESMYDVRGNLVQSRSRAYMENGTPIWSVTRTFYDENGRSIASTSPFFTDDAGTLLADLNDTDELRVSYSIYDALGRVIETQYLKGVTIDIASDAEHDGLYVTSFTYPTTPDIQTSSQTVYDAAGRVYQSISSTGTITTYEYDTAGRQIRTTLDIAPGSGDPDDQQITEVEYDSLGRQTLTRDALGNETRYTYDALGRLVQTTYADGTTTSTEYDNLGRRISETDQLGRTTQYEYDDAGRTTAVVLPEVIDPLTGELTNPRYEYGYDDQGQQTSITDPNGHTTNFTYDHLGRQLTRTLPLGTLTGVESSHYDDRTLADLIASGDDVTTSTALGQTAYMVDFEGNVTGYLYDNSALGSGRTTQVTYYAADDLAAAGITIAVGMTPAQIRAALAVITAARTVSYTYDDEGRIIEINDTARGSGGGIITNTYNDEDQLIRIASPEGIINYAYDDLGQLTRAWTGNTPGSHDGGTPTTETVYTYDELGRMATVRATYRAGIITTEPATIYHYDALGRIAAIERPNNVTAQYLYDSMSHVTAVYNFIDSNTNQMYDAGGGDTLVSVFEYTHDAYGNRLAATESFDTDNDGMIAVAQGDTVQTYTWQYDALNRLVSESFDSQLDDTLDYTDTFTYDLASNRQTLEHDAGSDGMTSAGDETTSYFYDANDRLLAEIKDNATSEDGDTQDTYTEYTYENTLQTGKTVYEGTDNSGNITSNTNYLYDATGRMIGVDTDGDHIADQIYIYDVNGVRVSQTDVATGKHTIYLIDPQNPTGYAKQIEEHIIDVGVDMLSRSYTLGLMIHAQTDHIAGLAGDAGTTLYFLQDAAGHTRALLNAIGQYARTADADQVAQILSYTAYGDLHNITQSQALTSWQRADGMYDQTTGLTNHILRWREGARFLCLDSYSGNNLSPLSLHKYIYGNANPIMGVDPSGEMAFTIGAPVLFAVTVGIALYITAPAAHGIFTAKPNVGPRTIPIVIHVNTFGQPSKRPMNLWKIQQMMKTSIEPSLNPAGSVDKIALQLRRAYAPPVTGLGWTNVGNPSPWWYMIAPTGYFGRAVGSRFSYLRSRWDGYMEFNTKASGIFATTHSSRSWYNPRAYTSYDEITTVYAKTVSSATTWHGWMYPNMLAHEQIYLGAFNGTDNNPLYGSGFSLNSGSGLSYQLNPVPIPINAAWIKQFRSDIGAK
jgi:YD repeat-containing protein